MQKNVYKKTKLFSILFEDITQIPLKHFKITTIIITAERRFKLFD